MKIFHAMISCSLPYEDLGDAYSEYGTDIKVLMQRMSAAALKIAPDAAWSDDGEYTSNKSGITFQATVYEVELVC